MPTLQEILNNRKSMLTKVAQKQEELKNVEEQLHALDKAVDDLLNCTGLEENTKGLLQGFSTQPCRDLIKKKKDTLETLGRKFSRDRIVVGSSGKARVGKSTLLKQISGLDDNVIPTGDNLPVTAVRSKIFYSSTKNAATIFMHDFSSFRDNVLRPYHEMLELGAVPNGIREFERVSYPAPGDPIHNYSEKMQVMVSQLREMQSALPSYLNHLTGTYNTIDLRDDEKRAGLRKFTAKPGHGDDHNRPYLAVKEIVIECRFPKVEAEHFGFIDLPGLGEILPNAEKRHLENLKDEVDLVLLTKRSTATERFWNDSDSQLLEDLKNINESLKENAGDFLIVAINNEQGTTPDQLQALIDDINKALNPGSEQRYPVVVAKYSDQSDVNKNIVLPVLRHLQEKLPVMDRRMLECVTDMNDCRSELKRILDEVNVFIRTIPVKELNEEIDKRAEDLRTKLQGKLGELIKEYDLLSVTGENNSALAAQAGKIDREIQTWIENGFGRDGKEAWLREAQNKNALKGGYLGFAEEERNNIRVEIGMRYWQITDSIAELENSFFEKISGVLRECFGDLVPDLPGREAVQVLADKLGSSVNPALGAIPEAIRNLLETRIDFRINFYPQIRTELKQLEQDIVKHESISEDNLSWLSDNLTVLASGCSYNIVKSLCHSSMPYRVFWASLDMFADSLIRHRNSLQDFRRLVRHYGNELWPDQFKEMDSHNHMILALRHVAETLGNI
ncbi:MAG: hypothetical protein PHQ23_07260 [Candidatus Wallbacteria bacterium]|nr:hypothetical protein [Candidatus Wallbacteria bacterium]